MFAYIVGLLKTTGRRFVANHADDATLEELSDPGKEPIGRSGYVTTDTTEGGKNLFSLKLLTKL